MVKLAAFLVIPKKDPKKRLMETEGYRFSLSLPDQLGLIFPSGFANHTSRFPSMKNNPQMHLKRVLTFNVMYKDTQVRAHAVLPTETEGKIDVEALRANVSWVHKSSCPLWQTSHIQRAALSHLGGQTMAQNRHCNEQKRNHLFYREVFFGLHILSLCRARKAPRAPRTDSDFSLNLYGVLN